MRERKNVSLRGERRIGKTSLLYYLAHPDSAVKARLPETHIPVYFNFEPLRGVRIDDVWLSMTKTVAMQISERIPAKEAESEEFFTTATELSYSEGFASGFSKALAATLSDCKIHLLFDEFEQAENPELGEPFYTSLHKLLDETENISYVIATHLNACTGLKVLQMDGQASDSGFIMLSPLQESEVRSLIFGYFSWAGLDTGLAQKLCGDMPFLYDLTGYHPFFLQVYCHHIYRKLDMPDWPLGRAKKAALEAFKKDVDSELIYYWQVSSPKEQEVTKKLVTNSSFGRDDPKTGEVLKKLEDRCLLVRPFGAENSWQLFSSVYRDWVKLIYRNPFIYGRPVRPDELVNRKSELTTLLNRLMNRESTAITGEPHIGKTSLLLTAKDASIQERYAGENIENFLFRFLDLQAIEGDYTFGHFWEEALQIERETADYADVTDRLRECTQKNYSRFSLLGLFETLAARDLTLVLLLDEFDRLLSHPNFKNSPGFFGNLRSLSTISGSLVIITASRQPVAEMNQWGKELLDRGSALFNHFAEVKLKPFDEEAAEEFFAPHKNRFTDQEIETLRCLSGSHPFLLQAAAASWLDANGNKENAANMFYDKVSAHFDDLWDTLDDKTRTVALILCLAELSEKAFDCSRLKDIDGFTHQLCILTERGLAVNAGKKWPCDLSVPLEYKGKSWIISSRAFTRWVRDAVINGTRPVPSYDEWLKNKKYEMFLSRETWESLLRPPATQAGTPTSVPSSPRMRDSRKYHGIT